MNLMLVNVRCKKAVTLLSGERKLIQRQNLKIFLRKSIFFYINAGVIKLTFTFNIPNLVRVSSIFPLSIRKSKVCTQRTISPVTKSTVCCTDFS